jgi:carbohydrate kinase (thermoresistant glucokinase family)
MHVLVMGVSGSGKTTVGTALAEKLGVEFVEADDFHSAANKAKMHAEIPLTDEDRAPWLAAIHSYLQSLPDGWVLACSALKRAYRETLVDDFPDAHVVFLTASEKVLEERLEARSGHFVDAGLLPSQLATLEPPEGALTVDVSPSVNEIVQTILTGLGATPA